MRGKERGKEREREWREREDKRKGPVFRNQGLLWKSLWKEGSDLGVPLILPQSMDFK